MFQAEEAAEPADKRALGTRTFAFAKRPSFAFAKRYPSRTFAFAKRDGGAVDEDSAEVEEDAADLDKRSPYKFAFAKKWGSRQFAFAKRNPYRSFAFA